MAGRPKKTAASISTEEAKRRFLDARGKGLGVRESALAASRSEKTYDYWRSTDPAFKSRADQIAALAKIKRDDSSPKDISFAEFSETFLGQRVFWHQQQWIDILEGREPRDLHLSQTYEPHSPRRLLVNTPVHHAKSTTLTVNYTIYRLCMNPNLRVKFVSKTQTKAREFLQSVKTVLTSPEYQPLQIAYGPPGGWGNGVLPWRADYIYLDRDGKEKDPSVEALGIRGHIYGSRAGLIILDDCITAENAHEWERQISWINKEVQSRLGKTGKLVVIGTRIAPMDLYRQLRNGDNFSRGVTPWTYFAQPAVLRFEDDPAEWETLWPKSNAPIEDSEDEPETPDEDGLYQAWDGPSLSEVRDSVSATDWAMVYMQQDTHETATFAGYAVNGSCNGMRNVGPLVAGAAGHRREGMAGLYVIGSMDPSGSGQSAFVVYAVDPQTQKRYVLDAKTLSPWNWDEVTGLVKDWTTTYGIAEWVCEKNMYHTGFRHNKPLMEWLQTNGVRTEEHYTGSNKHDVNLGVMSLAPLFGAWEQSGEGRGTYVATVEPAIELPRRQSHHVLSLIEQLVTWAPDTKNKTDLVMALWFAELRARTKLQISSNRQRHVPNRFGTRRRAAGQGVVNLREFARERETA